MTSVYFIALGNLLYIPCTQYLFCYYDNVCLPVIFTCMRFELTLVGSTVQGLNSYSPSFVNGTCNLVIANQNLTDHTLRVAKIGVYLAASSYNADCKRCAVKSKGWVVCDRTYHCAGCALVLNSETMGIWGWKQCSYGAIGVAN